MCAHLFVKVCTGYLQRSHTVHTQMGEISVHMCVCVYTYSQKLSNSSSVKYSEILSTDGEMGCWARWGMKCQSTVLI